MKKQCAAVSTHCAPMMVPPQMWTGPYCTLTCQGHLLTEVSFPPMIRPKIRCPQAGGGESKGLREGASPGGCTPQVPPMVLGGPADTVGLQSSSLFFGNCPVCPTHCKNSRMRLPQAFIRPCLPLSVRPAGQPAYLCIAGRRTSP